MDQQWFRVHQENAVRIVELALPQHLDSGEFDRLNDALLAQFADEPQGHWVIDLADLQYMGSSVLGLMVNIRQRVKEAGGRLVLCGMSPRLLRIFQTCCLERLFVIRAGRAEATRAVSSGSDR